VSEFLKLLFLFSKVRPEDIVCVVCMGARMEGGGVEL